MKLVCAQTMDIVPNKITNTFRRARVATVVKEKELFPLWPLIIFASPILKLENDGLCDGQLLTIQDNYGSNQSHGWLLSWKPP